MKMINRYLALALTGGAFVLGVNAEKIRFDDLPLSLKDKIRVHTGGAPIEDIDKSTRDGKTFYEVAFKKDGKNTEFVFDESGSLQNNVASANLTSGKVAVTELPPVVRRVIESRLKGTPINDIDRRVENSAVTYEVGFKQGDQQQEIVVSQDGRILRDIQIPTSAIVASSTQPNSLNPLPLSDKRKMSYNELPSKVRHAVRSAARDAAIEDVERGQWRARTVYEIAFKDQGQHVELQVEENGRILHDPRLASGSGVPPATDSGQSSSSVYPDVKKSVTLSATEKVDRRSVPAPVERAITAYTGGAIVEDIERGSWRGMNVYEVAFKDKGKHVELQIDEKGNVVFDPRGK